MENTATNTSTALIPVRQSEVNSETVQTVNARDLHLFLEIRKDFSTWIKDRIEQFDFTENQDFVCSPILGSKGRGGHNAKDYHLTMDMAKELSMVERNDKGKEARKYFIECERVAKSAPILDPSRILSDPAAMRGLLLTYTEKVLALQDTIKEQTPKVIFADAVSASHTSILVGDLAKLLKQNGIEIGANRLFEYLRAEGYLIRRKGIDWNSPTQRAMELGLFEVKERTINEPNGSIRITRTTTVTGKGQLYFVNRLIAVPGKMAA